MTQPTYARRQDALAAGWFSRRHQSSTPHQQAVAKYREESGKKARQRRAQERLDEKKKS